MANKLLIKRGTRAKLPTLGVGEPAFCTDTKELFVGSATGNVQYPNKDEVNKQLGERATLGVRTVIPSGADINTYKTVGCFTSKDNANTATLINSPFTGTTTFTLDVGNATGTDGNYYPTQTATEYISRRIKSRTWSPEKSKWFDWVDQANYMFQEITLLNGWRLKDATFKAFCSKCGNVGHITAWITNPSTIESWQGTPFLLPYKCAVLCDDAVYKSTGESMLVQIGGSSFNFHSDIPANADIHINITYICE